MKLRTRREMPPEDRAFDIEFAAAAVAALAIIAWATA